MSEYKPKVALGMSGGVDSSVCAHLLLQQGYDVTGVYLECWRAPGCRTEEDRKDALAVALSLGIPFKVLDFKEAYRQKVVENFFSEYEAGRTPNPDVLCNKEIKFGLFYDWAIAEGYEYVATGHYAAIQKLPDGSRHLTIPADTKKDQTYFLYLLREEQLQHVLFPLAELTKPQVREAARARTLAVSEKKDSVGICFIGDINVHQFLRERLGENPGEVVDTEGRVIGTHQGLWFYTIGQRHGFTIQAKTVIAQADGSTIDRQNIPPFYVISKKPATNQLVVGFGTDALKKEFTVILASESALLASLLAAATLEKKPIDCLVRIRHTGALLPCSIQRAGTSSELPLHITLNQPAMGIADGQSAVLYLEQTVQGATRTLLIGGGVISAETPFAG